MGFITDVIATILGRKNNNIKNENVIKQPQVKQKTKRIYKYRENTKHHQVKKHLIEKGWIDSWTAIELYGATRLSAIIFNLRKEGHNIISLSNCAYDRNQEICNYTTYKFIDFNGIN